jgi:hypothetical protein
VKKKTTYWKLFLQDWQDGRIADVLHVVDGHESERVAWHGSIGRVVDVVKLSPLFDVQDERLDAPVLVAVAFEQVGVPDSNVTVYI